jgi:hypothetical protein
MHLSCCTVECDLWKIACSIQENLLLNDKIAGVPIFLMGIFGKNHPGEVFAFFETVADMEDWIIREFAQASFRQVISSNRDIAPVVKAVSSIFFSESQAFCQ